MSKLSITYYYVQTQSKDSGLPEIIVKERFHKFHDYDKAQTFLESLKKTTPDVKARIVKCTETYDADDWI